MRCCWGRLLLARSASADQAVVFRVGADPELGAIIVPTDAKRAMFEADARRPEASDALKVK